MESLYRPALDRVLAELNRRNLHIPFRLNSTMVEIHSPSLFLGPGGLTNTRGLLRVREDTSAVQYFSGSTYVYYNRLHIAQMLRGLVVPGRNTDYTTAHDVLRWLKAEYHVPLTYEDVSPVLTGAFEDTIAISAHTESPGYFGVIYLPYADQQLT